MDFVIFNFPTPEKDGKREVETTFCELINRKRSGEYLHPEELDYLDFANTVLTQ
jgi:hypothetical protein